MAPSSPKSSSYQQKLAAAKAVGLDGNANWAQINEATALKKKQDELAATQAAAKRAKNEAELTITRNRNEEERRKNETNLTQQQQKQKSLVETDQQEREKMVRTFQTRRRGRASLRINLGSAAGSPYEGSSGISINL